MSRFYGKLPISSFITLAVIFLILAILGHLQTSPRSYAQSQPDMLGSISGTVRNQAGDPLPNISVYAGDLRISTPQIDLTYMRSTKTDAQGFYHFLSVTPGAYHLYFQDDSHLYAKILYPNSALVDEATMVNVSGNDMAGIDVVMTPANTVSATIDATLLSYPLNIVRTNLYRKTTTNRWVEFDFSDWDQEYDDGSLSDKEFVFLDLPDGSYGLCVSVDSPYDERHHNQSECYDNVRSGFEPMEGAQVIVLNGASHKTFALVLGDFHQLQGVVLSTTGEPLDNAEVIAQNLTLDIRDTFNVRTDSQGHFYFDVLPEDSYRIDINAQGYLFNYAAAPRVSVGPTSREIVTVTLQLGGNITGIVSLDGGGIAHNASVFAMPPDGPWETTPDYSAQAYADPATGAYTITGLEAGIYRVRAAFPYADWGQYVISFYGGPDLQSADDVLVSLGQTTPNINVTLGSGKFEGSIMGTVTAAGVPKADVEVALWLDVADVDSELYQPPMVTTVTDAQGKYHFGGLADGTYFVGFRDLHGVYATTFYTDELHGVPGVLVEGNTPRDNVNVNLVPGSSIRGTIHRPTGKNVADYQISLTMDPYRSVPYTDAVSDVNGDYEITGLSPGTYTVHVYGSSLYPGYAERAGIVVGENAIVEGIDFWIGTTFDVFLPTLSNNKR